MAKRKESYIKRRQKEEQINKKGIIWAAGIAVGIIVIVSVLLILDI
jgi:uncharacterized membrane protein YvbJ